MAEFDVVIEHCPGIEHVVPDTLSRAPLPEPSPVGDNLILPPAPISLFLTIMLGYDIPSHQPSLVNQVFSYPLDVSVWHVPLALLSPWSLAHLQISLAN